MNTNFDIELNELCKNEILKWIPWVGANYEHGKILFIGDSNYNDGEYVNDKGWTREFILIEGYNKESRNFGNSRLLRSIERTILDDNAYKIEMRKKLWSNVAYLNLSQKPVEIINKKKMRPSNNDLKDGWIALLETILILKPKIIIKWGIDGEGVLRDIIGNKITRWKFIETPFKIKNKELDIYERYYKLIHETGFSIFILFTNHPSGSWGYSKKINSWRKFIYNNNPEIKDILSSTYVK